MLCAHLKLPAMRPGRPAIDGRHLRVGAIGDEDAALRTVFVSSAGGFLRHWGGGGARGLRLEYRCKVDLKGTSDGTASRAPDRAARAGVDRDEIGRASCRESG